MPKVRRERTKFHAPAHKSQRQYAVPDATASLDEAAPSEPSSKTEKRKLRHEQFLNSRRTYAKSHLTVELEQTRPTRKSKKKSKDTTQVFSMLNLLAQVTPPAPDSKPAKPDRQANTLQGGLAAHAKTPKKLTAKKQQAMAYCIAVLTGV
jgi:hypothetical protein